MTSKNNTNSPLSNEQQFFSDVRELLRTSRETAYRSINSVMIKTYWHIGKRIVEQEQHGKARAGYGEYLIVNLSRYLTDCFGKGFTVANLWNFKRFYLTFTNLEQFSTHRVENLCWSHLRLIMRLDDEKERYYYLLEASQQNWTTRLLERNIKSGYYRRLLSSQNLNQSEIANQSNIPHPSDFIKDPYILEFLDVPENITGKESLLGSPTKISFRVRQGVFIYC